jgi:hypothetical protein
MILTQYKINKYLTSLLYVIFFKQIKKWTKIHVNRLKSLQNRGSSTPKLLEVAWLGVVSANSNQAIEVAKPPCQT